MHRLATLMTVLLLSSPAVGQVKEPTPLEAIRIKPGDRLFVHVLNTLPGHPIKGAIVVEDSGKLPLGPMYGRAVVHGLTYEEAENVIQERMKSYLKDPVVQVTRFDPVASRVCELDEQVRLLGAIVEKLKGR